MTMTTGSVDSNAIVKRIEGEGGMKRLGWRALDTADFGLNAGELAIVAGRPGHGKTTVLLNTLVNWLENFSDETFVLISHEVPVQAVVIKLLSILTRRLGRAGWAYNDLRALLQGGAKSAPAGLDPNDVDAALAKLRELEGRLRVIYEPSWTVEDVDRYLKSVVATTKVGGIFVDYLQLVAGPRGLQYESRDHEISTAAKHLKRTAVDIAAPMIAAAQISRDVAWAVDYIPGTSLDDERVVREIIKRRPQLHHVGEGGGDQEADLVLGILNYRAELVSAVEAEGLNPERLAISGDANPFEILVLKNRYGRLVTAPLVIELKSGYIRDQGVFGK